MCYFTRPANIAYETDYEFTWSIGRLNIVWVEHAWTRAASHWTTKLDTTRIETKLLMWF